MPGTCFGDEYAVLLLCPKCPGELDPHVHSVPSVLIAADPLSCPSPELRASLAHVVPGI